MTSRSVRLSIDSRVENVGLVAMSASRLGEAAGLLPQQCYNIELCVAEAVTNVIEHAYELQPGHSVDVDVTLHEDRIEITILDRGRSMPPDGPPNIDFDPEDLSTVHEGGRGLFLLQELLTRVEYRRVGEENRLVLVHELPREPQSEAASQAG